MEEFDIIKLELLIQTYQDSGFTKGYGIVWSDGYIDENPQNDFWITLPLKKTYEIIDYANIDKDKTIQKIERQEINPYFIEYSFFDQIVRNKINNGSELTDAQILYIKSIRIETVLFSQEEMIEWYDNIGKNEFPWILPNGEKITEKEIEKQDFNLNSIISKADYLNIKVYE